LSELDLIKQINNLQKQVDGLIRPEVGRWVDWTPTVTQNGARTFTTTYAYYTTHGKTVHVIAKLVITDAGTAGNVISVGSLPVAILNAAGDGLDTVGKFTYLDGGTFYVGNAYGATTTSVSFVVHNATSGLGISPSFAVANGDAIGINLKYRST
jgi:hypothetical protein